MGLAKSFSKGPLYGPLGVLGFLIIMATTVAADVLNSSSTAELNSSSAIVEALLLIAKELKTSADDWWKVSLVSAAFLFVIAILTWTLGNPKPYLVDLGRKIWTRLKALRPRRLEAAVATGGAQIAASLDRMKRTIAQKMEWVDSDHLHVQPHHRDNPAPPPPLHIDL